MSIQSINARNQFRGKIKEIILGPVVSEVDVDTPAGIVTSVITTRSVKELDLQVGTGAGLRQGHRGVGRQALTRGRNLVAASCGAASCGTARSGRRLLRPATAAGDCFKPCAVAFYPAAMPKCRAPGSEPDPLAGP